MASSVLSLQWGLDATATDTLSVSRGLVMAATTDNVAMLALLACEKFGCTLPASSMSMQKVTSALVPRDPAPIAFLKATVGFLHNDCAMHLGTSAAGVRFLVFAAALIPTAGVFQSAITLDKMLQDSASDLTFVPPQQGLRDLLRVLGPRVPACGFFDSVVFCEKLVEEQIVPRILSANIPSDVSHKEVQRLKDFMLNGVPATETLAELINAFRQIGRLGPETVATLTIRTGTGIPWLLAFTQWCLDFPISLSVGNFNVLAPADTKVHILVPEDVKDLQKRMKITTHHQLERLDTLIQPSSQDTIDVPSAFYHPASRLVTLGTYREHLLRGLGFDRCPPEVLREAIEYSIPLFLSYALQLNRVECETRKGPGEHPSKIELDSYYLRPFPGVHVVSRVARKLLSINEPLSFKKLDEGQSIGNLPQVSRHLAQLQQTRCHECNVPDRGVPWPRSSSSWIASYYRRFSSIVAASSRASAARDGSTNPEPWDIGFCSERHFFRSLATLTCEIFAISIFRDPEAIFLQPPNYQSNPFQRLVFEVRGLLECPQKALVGMPFHDYTLVRLAKHLVGHDDGTDKAKDDIISCRQGQVVYHAIFDTFRVEKYGYAELICLPGVLRYRGQKFNSLVKGETIPSRPDPAVAPTTRLHKDDIQTPPNFEDTSISWRISLSGETTLEAMLLRTSKMHGTMKDADPSALLDRLGPASILETCTHSQATPVGRIDADIFNAPVGQTINHMRYSAAIHVVRVGRAADQLCFALASIKQNQPVVIGRGACFGCCVRLCRALGAQVLFFCTS